MNFKRLLNQVHALILTKKKKNKENEIKNEPLTIFCPG